MTDEPVPPRSPDLGRWKGGWSSVGLRRLSFVVRLREERDQLARELDRQTLVIRINRLLLDSLEPEELFVAISTALWERTRHHFMSLTSYEEGEPVERMRLLDLPTERGRFHIGSGPVPDVLPPARFAFARNSGTLAVGPQEEPACRSIPASPTPCRAYQRRP